MCGIAGSTRPDEDALRAMGAALRHRGPDGDGLWRDPDGGCGFAHTRLAVLDLGPAAAQPMVSACGRYVLAYNGEIYNFRTLGAELAEAGVEVRSTGDTEVLLEVLARQGEAALPRLVGMFAFALWDRQQRSLLLVRDRLGIKPLVHAPLEGGHIAFASEIAALARHPGVDRDTDPQAVSEFLACLYVPAPRTIHRGIRKLPPGHLLRWQGGRTTIERWWAPSFRGEGTANLDEAVEETLPLLRDAVAGRMVADVPVGCFLSGGIDSSVVAALMSEAARRGGGPPVRTFTMTFDEPTHDERAAARRVADRLGSTHTELPASPRLADLLEDHLASFGEPFGNPTALLVHDLSRKAREHVTVALAGDGGDEVFAGYPRYRGGLVAARYRALPRVLRRRVVEPAARLIRDGAGGPSRRRLRQFLEEASRPPAEAYAAWVEYFSPAERAALLGGGVEGRPVAELYAGAPSENPLDAMQQTDLLSFLPGNLLAYGDAMSMRHGLELRLPLIDHRVVEAVSRFSPAVRVGRGLKTLLRAVARRLLPANLVAGTKRGFNPPMAHWLRGDLAPLVAERLTPASLNGTGLCWRPVETLLEEHRRGFRDNGLKIWALLVLVTWHAGR